MTTTITTRTPTTTIQINITKSVEKKNQFVKKEISKTLSEKNESKLTKVKRLLEIAR